MKSPKIKQISDLETWLNQKIGAAALERILILNMKK